MSWKREHSKLYSNTDEEGSRWMVWRENYHKILEHNKANHSFALRLNQFADLVGILVITVHVVVSFIWITFSTDTRGVCLFLPGHSETLL